MRIIIDRFLIATVVYCTMFFISSTATSQTVTLQQVTIVQDKSNATVAEKAAGELLSSEVQKRIGVQWQFSSSWPASGDIILLKRVTAKSTEKLVLPTIPVVSSKAESFRIVGMLHQSQQVIVIEGADERGILFGVGQLLRMFQYQQASVVLPQMPSIASILGG